MKIQELIFQNQTNQVGNKDSIQNSDNGIDGCVAQSSVIISIIFRLTITIEIRYVLHDSWNNKKKQKEREQQKEIRCMIDTW